MQEEQTLTALKKDSKLHVLVNYEQARPNYFYGTYVVSKSWLGGNEATIATMKQYKIFSGAEPSVSSLVNTGPPAAAITKLGSMTDGKQSN